MTFRIDIGEYIQGIPKGYYSIKALHKRSALRKLKDGTQTVCGAVRWETET